MLAGHNDTNRLSANDNNCSLNDEYNDRVSVPTVVANDTVGCNESPNAVVHLTYDIDYEDDDDSIMQAATQLVIADSQRRFSANEVEDDDDNVHSLNSFIVFDDPRYGAENPPEKLPQKETRAQKKERQEKWKNMKDYGIIHRCKIARDIEMYMLCKCCVADVLSGVAPVNMDIKELGVMVHSMTSSFACILTIECRKNCIPSISSQPGG